MEYCANTAEFWSISACLRDRDRNTQRGQIPSIHGDSTGFLGRKVAREIKQKSKVRHYSHQGKPISIRAQCARVQTQMPGEHPTAAECQKNKRTFLFVSLWKQYCLSDLMNMSNVCIYWPCNYGMAIFKNAFTPSAVYVEWSPVSSRCPHWDTRSSEERDLNSTLSFCLYFGPCLLDIRNMSNHIHVWKPGRLTERNNFECD